MIETSVVCINGTYHSLLTIRNINFSMDKAWGIAENTDASIQEGFKIGRRNIKGILFIRNSWHNDTHIHTSSGRKGHGPNQFVIQNQIRRHDIDIIS